MIYLLHGEDIASSRKKMSELVPASRGIVRIDGKKQNIQDLDLALSNNSLFSEKKIVIVELFTKIKPQEKLLEMASVYLKDPDVNIFLWEDHILTPKVLSNFKNAMVFPFTFPKYYFAFLDGFLPKKSTVKLYREVLKTFEPEQVLFGLTKRVRQLLILKTGKANESSEFKSVQGWQLQKLTNQANLWTVEDLKNVFLKLAELDEKVKTGALLVDLSDHLDILLSDA